MKAKEPQVVLARRDDSGAACRVTLKAGRVVQVEETDAPPPADVWLMPALFDLQINGFAGVDFQQDEVTAAGLLKAAKALNAAACPRWMLTLMTEAWPLMLSRLRRLRRLRAESPVLHSAIAGWHLEGPFLSSQPGFHGAHDASLMLDPQPSHLRELREITEGDRVLLTLAPERRGAIEAIALAKELGFIVSLGHTDAPLSCLREAVAAGATGFTHLGNACPPLLDRHDNILWRVFEVEGLTVTLIADGIHVSPPLFRLCHRVLPAERIAYITDAVSAAGAPPGNYRVGRLEVEVGADQIVRRPHSRQYAGSALRPLDGVTRAAAMLGTDWRVVWRRFSEIPLRFAGLEASAAWTLISTASGVPVCSRL